MKREQIIDPLLDRVSMLYKRLDEVKTAEKRKQIENTIEKFKTMIDRRMKMGSGIKGNARMRNNDNS